MKFDLSFDEAWYLLSIGKSVVHEYDGALIFIRPQVRYEMTIAGKEHAGVSDVAALRDCKFSHIMGSSELARLSVELKKEVDDLKKDNSELRRMLGKDKPI